MTYEISILDTPPSLNASGRSNKYAQARLKSQWEGLCLVALLQAKVPKPLPFVSASAVVYTSDRRKRDVGNHRWMLEKSLGDILWKQGWLPDDTPEYYQFPYLSFHLDKSRHPLTVVTLDTERG